MGGEGGSIIGSRRCCEGGAGEIGNEVRGGSGNGSGTVSVYTLFGHQVRAASS